jgi:VIT1/CCC1 family predicted Fe2+/Mn2+ transporter
MTTPVTPRLARQLILDELFDLTLYRRLRPAATGSVAEVLDTLTPVEVRHLEFWQRFFGQRYDRLDFSRRCKLAAMLLLARLLGPRFVRLLLESIEVYGIQKYLTVWEAYQGTPLAAAVAEVLRDELGHEDAIVTQFASRRLSGEKIRSIFLGLNDGLVEMLGAVSGFFAAFASAGQVFVAALTVAVAGAFSMAAGVFVSSGSQQEVDDTERRRRRFLDGVAAPDDRSVQPLTQALIVGAVYFAGALVPILPVFFGARTVLASALVAGSMIVAVSFILSFITGMNVRRRIATNVAITTLAVVVTYTIGATARTLWGVAL